MLLNRAWLKSELVGSEAPAMVAHAVLKRTSHFLLLQFLPRLVRWGSSLFFKPLFKCSFFRDAFPEHIFPSPSTTPLSPSFLFAFLPGSSNQQKFLFTCWLPLLRENVSSLRAGTWLFIAVSARPQTVPDTLEALMKD